MNLTTIVACAWMSMFAGEPDSTATPDSSATPTLSATPPEREPRFVVDFLPSPFQLAGDLGVEWLYLPTVGLGAWTSASGGVGDSWLSGQSTDFTTFQAGLTWHPSGRLRSNAVYVRYCMVASEQEIPDDDNRIHRLRYESNQVRVGMLGRNHTWKRLGWFWNVGLGFKAGDSRAWWVGEVPESGETFAKWTRVLGYLDAGFGLSMEI